jgi:hypothetical protein
MELVDLLPQQILKFLFVFSEQLSFQYLVFFTYTLHNAHALLIILFSLFFLFSNKSKSRNYANFPFFMRLPQEIFRFKKTCNRFLELSRNQVWNFESVMFQ